jgi:GDP-4-dehydro-6-deoxy-D-mannose reductase
MTSVLITGSEGFVGTYLREALTKNEKYDITSFDLKAGQDIRDYEQIREAIDTSDPDLIFHLAAQPYVPESTSDIRRGYNINVLGTMNLLEAVRHTGCNAKILISGTTEEYGYEGHAETVTENTVPRPTTPYGASKLGAGQLGLVYSRLYGIPVIVTRACNHTGPRHSRSYAVPSFAKRVAEVEAGRSPMVRHGNLGSKRYYLDVRDVVQAYLQAIALEPGIYNVVASGAPYSMQEILNMLIEVATCRIPRLLDNSLFRPDSSLFPKFSSDKFKKATSWQPQIPIQKTLTDTLDYWRERI